MCSSEGQCAAGPGHDGEKPVGVYLRETREARGLHLDDAARITRIGKNYLVALEEGRFDKLPNAAYVKGFLRIYAGFLGLSGDAVVAMFERDISPQPIRTVAEKKPARQDSPQRCGKRHWLIPSILLALILMLAYFFDDHTPKPLPTPQVPVSSPVASAPVPVQSARSSVTVAPNLPTTLPEPPPVEVATSLSEQAGEGVVLRLKINQDSWLNITIDGAISQQYDLKAGDLIEWKGERFFTLDLGNAGGIEGEFNGKPLKPFGEQGKTAHVELKADGA